MNKTNVHTDSRASNGFSEQFQCPIAIPRVFCDSAAPSYLPSANTKSNARERKRTGHILLLSSNANVTIIQTARARHTIRDNQ